MRQSYSFIFTGRQQLYVMVCACNPCIKVLLKVSFKCCSRLVTHEGIQAVACGCSPHDEISAKTLSASSLVALLPSTYADAACPIRHGVLGMTLICAQIHTFVSHMHASPLSMA